ncbi:MAG: hypothetical protein QOI66_2190 [Myxococcales bacterium]|jgi:hypothetical protein|nr:hypothetical protein [Myxococcales bacterium]
MKRASRDRASIEQLIKPIAARFVAAIEEQIAVQTRAMVAEWLKRGAPGAQKGRTLERKPPRARPAAHAPATEARKLASPTFPSVIKKKAARRPKPQLAVQAPDPVYAERTAELNRLRSILRPTVLPALLPNIDGPSTVTPPAAAPAPPRIETTDGVKSLEEDVRDAIAFLSVLSPARCEAQIAAWAGRARLYQEAQNDGRTRIAAGLLLEKLRGLARAMGAGFIEALNPTFSTNDWGQYIKAKEKAAAETGTSPPPADEGSEAPAAGGDYGDVWR